MKRLAAVLGTAIAGSQAGHLLAYELRFGAAAQQLQGAGAHAYFPFLVKTFLGVAALALIASLCLIGLARLASGRSVEPRSAPSWFRLVAALYTLQLAFFFAQESAEGSAASQLFLWGMLGQLPVAFAGALALRWLLARLGPALASIAQRCELALQLFVESIVLRPAPAVVRPVRTVAGDPITRRGPPPSF